MICSNCQQIGNDIIVDTIYQIKTSSVLRFMLLLSDCWHLKLFVLNTIVIVVSTFLYCDLRKGDGKYHYSDLKLKEKSLR